MYCMGYFINTKRLRNGELYWSLVLRHEADGVRTQKRVKSKDLRQYGLLPSMSVEDARSRCKQLNLETRHFAKAESAKLRTLEQADLTRQMGKRLFPEKLVTEFEEERLKPKFFFGGANPEGKYKKALCRWRFVLKMLAKVDKVPSEWAKEPRVFYKYFTEQKVTAGYAVKCLAILNMWGYFVCEKQGKAFLPVPPPRGYDRQVIEDKADEEGTQDSLPLTPELLESKKSELKPEYYRWLYITLWLGLRPVEVENEYKLSTKIVRGKSIKVISVYQSKLMGVVKEKRWKHIPLLYPEQTKAVEFLEAKEWRKPYTPLLKEVFGERFFLYMGRKGFTEIMLEKGHRFETVADWLGHTDGGQLLKKHYRDSTRVEID
jgi:hypothetical protein